MTLLISALTKFLAGVALVGALLFPPAWTLYYPHAYLFLTSLFVPMLTVGIILYIKNPELLKKRLDGKEKQADQKGVVSVAALMFPAGFVVSARSTGLFRSRRIQ